MSGEFSVADVYCPVAAVPDDAASGQLNEWVGRHKAAFFAAEAENITQSRHRLGDL